MHVSWSFVFPIKEDYHQSVFIHVTPLSLDSHEMGWMTINHLQYYLLTLRQIAHITVIIHAVLVPWPGPE